MRLTTIENINNYKIFETLQSKKITINCLIFINFNRYNLKARVIIKSFLL